MRPKDTIEPQLPALSEETQNKLGDLLSEAIKFIQNHSAKEDTAAKIRYATSHLLAFSTYLGGNGADADQIVSRAYLRNKEVK